MRYLIVRTDCLGDGVLSSAFISSLSDLANVTIDILCASYNYPVFQYNPHLEQKFYLYLSPKHEDEENHNLQTNQLLHLQNYAAIFVLNRTISAYRLISKVRTKFIFGHRMGVKSTRSKLFCFFTEQYKKYNYIPYDDNIHEVVNLHILLEFGLNKMKVLNGFHPHLQNKCQMHLENTHLLPLEQRLDNAVVLNISGRMSSERYITSSLARTIIEDLVRRNVSVLLVADKNDEARGLSLLSEFPLNERIQFCCEGNLFTVANIISQYRYFVGADGGLVHVAAGLQMKCVDLFHKQNISAWHPWCEHYICLQTKDRRIYDLTSQEVMMALEKLGLS